MRQQVAAVPCKSILTAWTTRNAKLLFDLDLLEHLGTALGAPHVKKISGKIWELRTIGRLQHRTFYFAASGRQIVLLHAFTKKTPKAPRAEIETAGRRMDDFLQRTGKG